MPGGEVWSVNPVFFLLDEPAAISQAEALASAVAINNIVLSTAIRSQWSLGTTWTGVRVEARTRDGVLEALGESAKATPVPGTSATPHPYQTATVTSLKSGFAGGQGRGRLYWPATGATVDATTLRMNSSNVGTFLTGVRTFLAAITTAITPSVGPNELVVWSRTGTAMHKVLTIRQGDVLDTQRRRRDSLAEAYQELTYPT
jgi:hypothetical protein